MGSSHSTPPPLVQVSAPRGKVLVPAGTAFTVHPPPSYARSRSDAFTRGAGGPVYTRYTGGRARARRAWNTPRYGHDGGTDIDIAEETSEEGENMTAEMLMNDGMRRRRGGVKANPVAMDNTMGQAGAFERLDPLDTRPRSAPEMAGVDGYAGMPPEYTSSPNLAGYGGDGTMAGAGMVDAFSSYPGPRPSPQSSKGGPSAQPVPRGRPNHYEHVPMGAYADVKRATKSPEPRVHQQTWTQTHGNCGQTPSNKVTPWGHEWLKGDAFLDACTCTTNCRCRKGQRVLYRARDSRPKAGSESEGEAHEYTSGEIRYVLKDDVGRDCGDYTRCGKGEGDGADETQRHKKKNQKEGKKLHRQLQGLKKELLDALDERFDDMRWEHGCGHSQRGEARSPAQPWLGATGLGQGGVRMYPQHGVVGPEVGPMPHGVSGLAAAGMPGHGSDVPDGEDGGHDSHTREKRQATGPRSTSGYGAAAGRHQGLYSHTPAGRGSANKRHRMRSYESDGRDLRQQQRAGRERTSRRGGGRLGRREQDVASRQQRSEKHWEGRRQARADSDDGTEY